MIKRAAAIYSITVGASMLMMWLVFYLTGSIPELTTERERIIFHLAAEITTATALIIAGTGLLKTKRWGDQLYLLSTGALIYTAIQSPGYFLQNGEIGFVVMFAVLLAVAFVLLVSMIKNRED